MTGLTMRQAECLGVINRTVARGSEPKIAAVAAELGISGPAAFKLIETLQAKGFVSRIKGQPGTLRVVEIPTSVKGWWSDLPTPELTQLRRDVEAELVRRAVS